MFENEKLGVFDKNGTELKNGDKVRILYTDWSSKSDDDSRTLEQYKKDISRTGVVYFDINMSCFRIKFANSGDGSIQPGAHGEISICT